MSDSARFHGLRDSILAVVNDVFAERVRLSFMGSDGRLDPARPMTEIEAVLRVGPVNIVPFGEGMQVMIAAGKAELHIDAARYAGPLIRSRDRVRALARRGEPLFDVLTVADRGEGRLVLNLGAI